ncbi:hypothetical protein AOLI_G00245960 [Acnodon oligacanthus]
MVTPLTLEHTQSVEINMLTEQTHFTGPMENNDDPSKIQHHISYVTHRLLGVPADEEDRQQPGKDPAASQASPYLRDSVVLHWDIIEQEQPEPGEQFMICYKLFHPTTEAEGNLVAKITCGSYCLRIDNLMPDRFYEFTVKRVDSYLSVYSLWTDSIILKTALGATGSSEENIEKS